MDTISRNKTRGQLIRQSFLFTVIFSGFVVTDGTSGHSTENAVMTRIVACDPAWGRAAGIMSQCLLTA